MLMHKNIHKILQNNMYYPRIILSRYCIHGYNHETILFFSYFSAKYAYLAMHIKKRWQALTACHPFAEEERLELPSSVLETNVLPLNYSSVV